jgi:putative peptidoglycan lipid II flippase
MCSRILGLVREQAFAALFGAGFTYDAFVVAFRIPNLLRDLFGEGALSAAFVTVFSAYLANRSPQETWRLASNVLNFILVLLSLITLGGIIFAESIVSVLAPGFALIEGKALLTVQLTRIMLPFLVFISLSAVVMGILNSRGRFFIPALASSFFNLGSIVCGVSLAFILPRYGYPAITGMAVGTLVGGVLQLCVQLPSLLRSGFRYSLTLDLKDPGLHQVLRLMIPATIGLSATQINIFINTNFAASCVEGSVSWLYYAFRLVQLPIGMFGVALSVAMLPVLAGQAARKESEAMKKTMIHSLIMVFALTLPATAGLIILAEPIIRLIFEHGAFTATDTIATAQTLQFFAIGLFAYSANKVLVPAFYALDSPKYPVIASFMAIGFNLLIVIFTIEKLGHLAIAISTSATMLLNFSFLMIVLYIKMRGYPVKELLLGISKIISALLGLILFLWGISPWVSTIGSGLAFEASRLFLAILGAAVLYAGILHTLKLEELTLFTSKIRSKLRLGKGKSF